MISLNKPRRHPALAKGFGRSGEVDPPRPWIRATEGGFTLVELLMVMSITTVLLSLGAFALRHYWLAQSLQGGRGEVVSGLRGAQELAVTESQPLIFGVRFRVGSSDWDLVRYDPRPPAKCTVRGSQSFSAGVVVETASFLESAGITSTCRSQIAGAGSDQFAFFFPRGTATAGSVTLRQPSLDRSLSVSVTPMTGRVEET